MRLGEHQEAFTLDLGKLIIWAYDQGYRIRTGDVHAHDGHKDDSQHYKKLAADLNLFMNGDFITSTAGHKPLGDYWESLDEHNRWGGRYNDGNHYERMEELWAS